MSNKRSSLEPEGLTISYRALGTINIKELRDALVEDIHALIDIYNVQFVKNVRIKLYVTNEYGEEIRVRRPAGGTISFMDTHHYRPSCKDYDL